MKLFLFATHVEAAHAVALLKAREMSSNLFAIEGGKIAITGMGIAAALAATITYGLEADELWNLGFAGAVNRSLALHSLHSVKAIGKNLSFPNSLDEGSQSMAQNAYPELDINESGVRLISSDYPIFTRDLPPTFSTFDLVDMEGYGVAYGAKALKKRATLIKVVSDFASTGDQRLIHQEKEHLSQLLGQTVENLERN